MKYKSLWYLSACLALGTAYAEEEKKEQQLYRPSTPLVPQTMSAVRFDISLPLRLMTPMPIVGKDKRGTNMVDPGPVNNNGDAPFVPDSVLQGELGALPGPVKQSDFFAIDNIGGVSPPDPVGDVGPNHYVTMTNLSFVVQDKSGNTLFGPAANNTLWSGFGGDCESDNAGDPIVLYDQISDRWMLSQFTSSAGPQFYNCLAISTTPDPTGTYYRWAILNNNGIEDAFPDYPKYGIWSDGFYISTRDFGDTTYGVGVYALNRDDLISGVANPRIIYFYNDNSTAYLIGDGLLPADLDGSTLPPPGSPQYFVGTMDDGGPYGAPTDAISFWEFHADFDNIANSTFTNTAIINIASYDTQFPCSPGSRDCIPQLGTTNKIDIQSYRQRALHRLAYRNFGTHESLVTNQSVESSAGMGGIRWWEIRNPDTAPTIHQEGTYGPGATDGIHRWMGSIAQDSLGNMGLAYSASSALMNPAIRFTGRLADDALGSMNRTEGSIIEGTGSQTINSQRWGDYTSTNIDPVDDCTFWHVNEYYDTNGGDWQIRVGSFKFNECGDPGFFLSSSSPSQAICVGNSANYDLNIDSVGGYDGVVTLSNTGEPAGSVVAYSTNPIPSLPGTSTVTVSNTAGITAGDYMINILGTSPTVSDQNIMLSLNVEDAAPASTTLLAPANGSIGADNPPSLSWTDTGAVDYLVEIATDSGFTNVIFSDTTAGTTLVPAVSLNSSSTYFWRVSSNNSCGTSAPSTAFSFTTSTLICFSVNAAIPDNTPAGLDTVFSIPDSGTLSNIDVAVEATHTWVGDVSFTISKDGTDVLIMDRPGVPVSTFGCSGDNVSATFTDSSAVPVETECGTNPAITGDLQPQEPLSAFDGVEFSGDWTFNASDNAAGDTGTLTEVCFVPSFATPACDPAPPVGDPDIIYFNGFQCVQEL